ncbi:phosphatase PAP2 family protein [Roseomonas hellenica]|uniref:Phosphatase PAP2 family protein n=1 Tax=Plastoroseomonas hellenica TaxID=2687306 RepID=A0ABS5F4U0_9PROT|nr:phosphatase PAP2 family protein [Plastoroseomonas hellenica]MBR0667511.1 phosphatase PAP2 family protein [Plastoroseomonas hellenica]
MSSRRAYPQTVPAVSRRGEPPRPARRPRAGAILAMLLGIGGFLAVFAARRGGDALYWNKWLIAELAREVERLPAWAPEAVRDIAGLGSPAVLAVVAAAIFLAVMARDGLGPAIGVPLMLGFLAVAAALLKLGFVHSGPAAPDLTTQLLQAGFPSANALFAGVLWARLFRLLGEGAFLPFVGWLLAGVVCLARISLGQHAPADVAAGLCAALVVLGALAWAGAAGKR